MQKQEEKNTLEVRAVSGGKTELRKEEKKTLRNGVCQQKHLKSAQGSSSYVEQLDCFNN